MLLLLLSQIKLLQVQIWELPAAHLLLPHCPQVLMPVV